LYENIFNELKLIACPRILYIRNLLSESVRG